MPKKISRLKKHLKRLHKVKVHHNRWLIWTLALSAIALIGLLSYIKVNDYRNDTEMMEYVPVIRKAVTYSDYRLGFSIKHPVAWSAETDEANTISFLDPQNYGEGISITVTESKNEKTYRNSLVPVLNETEFGLDGENASYITIGKRTAPEKVVLVHRLGRLYVIRGTGMMFDKILPTFKFTGLRIEPLPGSKLQITKPKTK